jgi:hypothetical protein
VVFGATTASAMATATSSPTTTTTTTITTVTTTTTAAAAAATAPTIVLQSDRKVTQPIPDTSSICQKINYIELRKKNNVTSGVGNIHRV